MVNLFEHLRKKRIEEEEAARQQEIDRWNALAKQRSRVKEYDSLVTEVLSHLMEAAYPDGKLEDQEWTVLKKHGDMGWINHVRVKLMFDGNSNPNGFLCMIVGENKSVNVGLSRSELIRGLKLLHENSTK